MLKILPEGTERSRLQKEPAEGSIPNRGKLSDVTPLFQGLLC